MPAKLPDINVDRITNLEDAKKIITLLLNSIEGQAKQITALEEKISLLEKEIAILKQQPHKPHFSNKEQSSFSATKLLKKKDNKWHKVKRQKIEIDQHVQLQEADTCDCGSKEFETISTTTKIIQGLIIRRNNTAYHGRRKKCKSCGKILVTQIPADVKGLWGKTIHVVASFPEDGGKMKGTITGDCTGKITGYYSGDDYGRKLEGIATARCPIFFFTLKPNATFKGKVNNTNTSVDLHYATHIADHTITGVFPFPLTAN